MIISVNWLKKLTDITLPVNELATLIGARLVEIEEVIPLAKKYEGAVIARVVECSKLENSDHLNVTKLDDGGVVQDIERDENGYVQVVCGAPNVRAGLLVVWLPPKTVVPSTYSTAEPFMLGARKLRGVMSNGMIASEHELDLSDDHDGIMEITSDVAPGTSLVEVFELDDYLLDIENKSLTHRPDAFGVVGFAREVAGIQGNAFTTPDWLQTSQIPRDGDGSIETPEVAIENSQLSERYQAVVLSNVDATQKSPAEIATYLSRVGVRSMNAVVDVTNYLMLLSGQPLHAFDYDKVVALTGETNVRLSVRAGRKNERLELLDGRTIILTPEDIVIAAGETAVALAGAMGGASTAIDASTKRVILESATFNLYSLRATQMRHGIFTEAITRFTKGQPAELTQPVLLEAVRLLERFTDASQSSAVADVYPQPALLPSIKMSVEKINQVLGFQFSVDVVKSTLQNVEFLVEQNGNNLVVRPPYWRADITIVEDVIEEIGRLNGFDTIEPTLPMRTFAAVSPSSFDILRSDIRKTLARAGANEVFTYSFVHGDMLTKASQDTQHSYRIVNSISPDLQYYRQTLTPSLLQHVRTNSKAGYNEFAIFELNRVHNKIHGLDDENVPGEIDMLALTIAKKKADGAPYYQAKALLDFVAHQLGLMFIYSPIDDEPGYPVTVPFESRRSAYVTDAASGEFLGIIGEYKRSVAKNFKLPAYCAGFEIGLKSLEKAVAARENTYKAPSRYPSTDRDICFQVASGVLYGDIVKTMQGVLRATQLEISLQPIDFYQPEAGDMKNITVRMTLNSHERTLTADEANHIVDDVAQAVISKFSATVM